MKSTVALIGCDTYDDKQVSEAVRAGLDLIGGISCFVKPGEKIVIKPNVLIGSNPEKCVCTHPSVFRAVGEVLLASGARVACGDSSGFGSCQANMRKAGLKEVADELGIGLADFDSGRVVTHKEALLKKRFVIANGVLEADGLVSLSKLKTHGLTRFTGAVKNQFGCIPGWTKKQHHAEMPDPYDFATMLVDLNTLLKPRLYIMDGIMAMEGNGPSSGNPRKLGVLLFSRDPVALDAVACKIIAMDPTLVPTFEPGERAGLGTYHDDNIEVVGENVEAFICQDFDIVRKPPVAYPGERMWAFLKNRTCPRPVINKTLCISCGTCVQHCPVTPKAVNWSKGDESRPPVHNYNLCIRCFCCQELCPEGAISINKPLLGRIFFR
jgi:uncharacterized protein (DUF362 family)/ferredoxin